MKKLLHIIFLSTAISTLAQNSMVSSANNAQSSQGSISYTIGQTVFTNSTSTHGTIEQGIQQPYTISQTLGTLNNDISLKMIAFPNPTTNTLQLKIENYNKETSYNLSDISGKTLSHHKISNQQTIINMQSYPAATYFLSIYKQSKHIKTFKIIKN